MSSLFENFKIKTPTVEQHRAASLKWLENVRPTLIDQWPSDLAKLSFKTDFVEVHAGELVKEFYDIHDGMKPGKLMNELASRLDAIMGWDRKFVRLNSRSPKDAPWPFLSPGTISDKEALSFFACSMRILDDLMEFQYVPEQPAYICLREWQYAMQTEDEYRCFVKDGELIAVTAYDYSKEVTAPSDGGKANREAIDAYFLNSLKPVLHVEDVVFDLWITPRNGMILVELNPYGLSDPCFFRSYENVENAHSYIQYREASQ